MVISTPSLCTRGAVGLETSLSSEPSARSQVLIRDAIGALPGQHLLGLQAGRVVGEQIGVVVLSNKVNKTQNISLLF